MRHVLSFAQWIALIQSFHFDNLDFEFCRGVVEHVDCQKLVPCNVQLVEWRQERVGSQC